MRMRYRMSVIYGHPVIAATRALHFANHVTKRNGGSGDENESPGASLIMRMRRDNKKARMRLRARAAICD